MDVHGNLLLLTVRWPAIIPLFRKIDSQVFISIYSLYAGHQTGPEPPFDLCLTQSSLLYGVPPMTSVACFTLVFQVWNASFNTRVVDHSVNRRWRAFRPLLVSLQILEHLCDEYQPFNLACGRTLDCVYILGFCCSIHWVSSPRNNFSKQTILLLFYRLQNLVRNIHCRSSLCI